MTVVTTPSIRERLNYNFVNLFKSSGRRELAVPSQKLNATIQRLIKHDLLSVKSVSVAKADAIFLFDRYDLTFTLTKKYAGHFVLLRGLLEFSRPRTIKINSNTSDKSFRVEFSEKEADHIVSYIEAMLNSLLKEIKFKDSLRTLINFEQKVKREQALLYANLKLSA